MKRLLKKEIKLVPIGVLNGRYCRILKMGEEMDAEDIPVADAREILWIEDELRSRLIRLMGHDFYPPDRIELKPTIKAVVRGKKPRVGIKIKFKAVIKSSIGSKVATINVEADSKLEADKMIRKQIRALGLHGATYKIS